MAVTDRLTTGVELSLRALQPRRAVANIKVDRPIRIGVAHHEAIWRAGLGKRRVAHRPGVEARAVTAHQQHVGFLARDILGGDVALPVA